MTANTSTEVTKVSKVMSSEIEEILGPPPLLSTEDSKAYNLAIEQLADAVQPGDMIAWFLIKDIADLRTEISRYRRIKTGVVHNATPRCKVKIAQSLMVEWAKERRCIKDTASEAQRAIDMSLVDTKFIKEIEAVNATVDNELEFSSSLPTWLPWVERLEVLLRSAENRFHCAVEQLRDHLAGFGVTLKGNLNKLIEAEATSLAPDRLELVDAVGTSDHCEG